MKGRKKAFTHPCALSYFIASLKVSCFVLKDIEDTNTHKSHLQRFSCQALTFLNKDVG